MTAEMTQSIGVCYYPEHWPEEWWHEDAAMMRDAGITHVRIGEFAWSRLETRPGQYDFSWLRRAIDILHQAGLKIVLGTPTATPPKWIIDAMPDMVAVDEYGRPRKFGSRRHYCFSHLGYQQKCIEIVTALAREFGTHPAVIAWQIDNEYGCHDTIISYSEAALTGFRNWCQQKYGTIENLNRAWGNIFWSMEYRSFGEIDLPNLTVTEANPAHRMDFQRYSSDQVIVFNRRQAEILRHYSPQRALLHNFMGSTLSFDHYALSQDLDIATWDSYPLGFLDRDVKDPRRRLRYLRVGDPDLQAFHHDLYRACGRGRWWVMEQQPGAVNWAPHNPAPAPGAVRLWALEAFAHGAELVSYFRWRQAPFGQEQMHEGLLLPNSEPNKALQIIHELARDLKEIGAKVDTNLADIALVFDYESAWAWTIQPQGQSFSYLELVLDFYRSLRRKGLSIDIVPPEAAAIKNRRLVLLPGLFAPSEEFCHALKESGAVCLIGPRSGTKTKEFQIPKDLPPGPLKTLIDIRINTVETLPPPVQVAISGGGNDAAFSTWREFIATNADHDIVLMTEDGMPALVENEHALYLAGLPNEALLDEVIGRALSKAGITSQNLPEDLRIRENGRDRYIFNYGQEIQNISAYIKPGERLLLGSMVLPACGVALFRKN